MNKLLILLLFSQLSFAKTIRVGVIDTGFDFNSTWPLAAQYGLIPKLCKDRYDLATKSPEIGYNQDFVGHGTHIAGIIAKYAGNSDYCLVIIKMFNSQAGFAPEDSNKAWKLAAKLHLDIINYSAGGRGYDYIEHQLINKLLKQGVKIIVAAGNNGETLFKDYLDYPVGVIACNFFPACYFKDVVRVGNLAPYGIQESSNYGDAITVWRFGYMVYSILPGNNYGYMTGTSQATAIETGLTIKQLDQELKAGIR